MHNFRDMNIYYFQISNQLWWLTMIVHIVKLNKLQQNSNYRLVRAEILNIENWIKYSFLAIFIISNLIALFILCIQGIFHWEFIDKNRDENRKWLSDIGF